MTEVVDLTGEDLELDYEREEVETEETSGDDKPAAAISSADQAADDIPAQDEFVRQIDNVEKSSSDTLKSKVQVACDLDNSLLDTGMDDLDYGDDDNKPETEDIVSFQIDESEALIVEDKKETSDKTVVSKKGVDA